MRYFINVTGNGNILVRCNDTGDYKYVQSLEKAFKFIKDIEKPTKKEVIDE